MNENTDTTFVVCGLPETGKTTFLAALWHIVQSCELDSCLKLSSLEYSEFGYVNAIRSQWERGRRQPRTSGVANTVGLNLVDANERHVTLLFPDHAGETFEDMWINRFCSKPVADHLAGRSGTLLFLRPENLKRPVPLIDLIEEEAEMVAAGHGLVPMTANPESLKTWNAKESPDQVKIVDFLQTLSRRFPGRSGEKLAVFVSAWDMVPDKTPVKFIETQMPLLHQYLTHGEHDFDFQLYGVSAQGSEYMSEDHVGALPTELEALLEQPKASSRVKLVAGGTTTSDLTEPILWLMS